MKQITLLFILCATAISAQELTVLNGGTLSIDSNAQLFVNGLELQPSLNYDITGPNAFTTTQTPLSSPQSVSKIIQLSNPIKNYQGNVKFYYQNAVMNNIQESDLQLGIKESEMDWVIVDSNLDTTLKVIDFNFEKPSEFYGVTAFEKSTLSTESFDSSTLQIFPNPTASLLQVNYRNDLTIEVFNLLGSSILKTSSKTVDLSNLSTGTYLIKLTDVQTDASIFKQIIKK